MKILRDLAILALIFGLFVGAANAAYWVYKTYPEFVSGVFYTSLAWGLGLALNALRK